MSAVVVTGWERPPADRVERWTLVLLLAFTALAVAGYGVFALHPERLPSGGLATRVYNRAFPLFARGHILVAAGALAVVLSRRLGARWVPAALAVCVGAFAAEYAGTRFGVPFGGYEYTGLLGPKLAGRVPWVIPASWFLMALPAYAMARRAAPAAGGLDRAVRLALAAATLTAWDLALDPAMSHLTPYWVWEGRGAYYGMPLVNLAGWMGTGLVLVAAMEALGARRWVEALPVGWLAGYYGALLLMPVGMLAAAGVWPAIGLTAAALAGLAAAHAAWARRRSPAEARVRVPSGARALG